MERRPDHESFVACPSHGREEVRRTDVLGAATSPRVKAVLTREADRPGEAGGQLPAVDRFIRPEQPPGLKRSEGWRAEANYL